MPLRVHTHPPAPTVLTPPALTFRSSSRHVAAGMRSDCTSPMMGVHGTPFRKNDTLSKVMLGPPGDVAVPMGGSGDAAAGGGMVMASGRVTAPPAHPGLGRQFCFAPIQQVPGDWQPAPAAHHCHVWQPVTAQQAAVQLAASVAFTAWCSPQHSTPSMLTGNDAGPHAAPAAAPLATAASAPETATAAAARNRRIVGTFTAGSTKKGTRDLRAQ